MLAGIDYGSRLAGTTAIAWLQNKKVQIVQSTKGQDADQLIRDFLIDNHYQGVAYLDAPLSLPAVYSDPEHPKPNFFYRQADVEAKAMSPMFLGGLTARAMQLASELKLHRVQLMEVYPAKLASVLIPKELSYKKETNSIPEVSKILSEKFHFAYVQVPANWHQVDAVLALCSGIRHQQGLHTQLGNPKEGVIIF